MGMIDIREVHEDITQIKFSSDSMVATNLEFRDDEIALLDMYGGNDNTIRIDDIDNLIKALKKARELWT